MSFSDRSGQPDQGALLVELLEVEDSPDRHADPASSIGRQAMIDITADVVVLILGPSGGPLGDAEDAPRIYLQARPDGWRVYLHSDDSGDCSIVTLLDDGGQIYEPR